MASHSAIHHVQQVQWLFPLRLAQLVCCFADLVICAVLQGFIGDGPNAAIDTFVGIAAISFIILLYLTITMFRAKHLARNGLSACLDFGMGFFWVVGIVFLATQQVAESVCYNGCRLALGACVVGGIEFVLLCVTFAHNCSRWRRTRGSVVSKPSLKMGAITGDQIDDFADVNAAESARGTTYDNTQVESGYSAGYDAGYRAGFESSAPSSPSMPKAFDSAPRDRKM